MDMIEHIRERRATLTQQREQLIGQINATDGALQMLKELEEKLAESTATESGTEDV